MCNAATPAGGDSPVTRSPVPLVPISGALQLFDLALHEIPLERADVRDVKTAVEVVGLVLKRARQQVLAGHLEFFALRVLCANCDALGAPHLLAESRDTQAAFFADLLALGLDDLGVDQHQLVFRTLAVGDVDHGDLAGEADL